VQNPIRHLAVAAIALAAAALLPAAAPGRTTVGSAAWADPAADVATVPDVTSVVIANDDAGQLSLTVALANRPAGLTTGDYVQAYLDTDADASTGDNGWNYAVQLQSDGWALFEWSGGAWVSRLQLDATFAAPTSSVQFAHDAIRAVGLIEFFVYAGTEGTTDYDVAPDGEETYEYMLSLPLLLEELSAPQNARAGRKLSASATFLVDGEALPTVACAGRVGRTRVAGKGGALRILVLARGANGVSTTLGYEAWATCDWTIPKGARGKAFVGTMTVTRSGARFTRTFRLRVR
jgi:hypothetical protein